MIKSLSIVFLLVFCIAGLIIKPSGVFAQTPTPATTDDFRKLCEFAGDKQGACEACFEKNPPETWTAIGCIPTDPVAFLQKFLNLGIGLAGGIAFLLILFGGFGIMTSAGNPEKLNAGKELVTSAIAGLLLVVFSIFLLQLIGYNILGIPGFG